MLLWPKTVEQRAALRTAIAALAALLISFKFHLQTPYWSGMTVVVVANLYTGSVIDKAMMRIIGTVAGALLGLYLVGVVANSFFLYLVCCFLIISVCVYCYHYSSNYGYAYLLAALCAFIVISQIALDPQNAFWVAIWRPVEIAIGVVVAAISTYAVFPNHLKDNVLAQVNELFADVGDEFDQLAMAINTNACDFEGMKQSNLKLKKKIRKASELIAAMNHELGVTQGRVDEVRALLELFYDLCRQLQYLIIIYPTNSDLASIHYLVVDKLFLAVTADLTALQAAFANRSQAVIVLQSSVAIDELEERFRLQQQHKPARCDFVFSFIHFIRQVSRTCISLNSLLVPGAIPAGKNYQVISRQQRLRSDFELIKHSIKAGLTAILALGFWFISNWPGGLNGIISSLIISIRRNLYDMKNISIHRTLGCFLGGGVALASLALCAMDLYEFIIIMFVSVWAFTYFALKWPKYAQLGLQANIALIISLAQEGGPPTLLAPPLQRLGGIFIGILASFIVANVLWRMDVWTTLERYLAKLTQCIRFNLSQVMTKEQKSLHDLANMFWNTRGLIEALADESLTDAKRLRLTGIKQRFESLVMVQAAMSHILATVDRPKAIAMAHSFQLDLVHYEQTLLSVYERHDSKGGLALAQSLQEALEQIQVQATYPTSHYPNLRNLWAYINALYQLALKVP